MQSLRFRTAGARLERRCSSLAWLVSLTFGLLLVAAWWQGLRLSSPAELTPRVQTAAVCLNIKAPPVAAPEPEAEPEKTPERPPEPAPAPVRPSETVRKAVRRSEKPLVSASPPQAASAPAEAASAPAAQAVEAAPAPRAASAQPAPAVAETPRRDDRLVAALLALIEQEKHYPLAARRAGYVGTVVVTVRVESDGRISGHEILSHDANPVLRGAADKTLRRVRELGVPREAAGRAGAFEVPIVFTLN